MKALSLNLQYAQDGYLELRSLGTHSSGTPMLSFRCFDRVHGGAGELIVPELALVALATAATLALADHRSSAFRAELLALLSRAEGSK